MKKPISLTELRRIVRNVLEEEQYAPQYNVSDPASLNATNAAKAPPGLWWNPNVQRYESIPNGVAASKAADVATKNATDSASHGQAALANDAAAIAHRKAAAVAKEMGDADSQALHDAEEARHIKTAENHRDTQRQAAAAQSPEVPGQPTMPAHHGAKGTAGATSNQVKRV